MQIPGCIKIRNGATGIELIGITRLFYLEKDVVERNCVYPSKGLYALIMYFESIQFF